MRLNKNPLRILDCKKDRDHELMKTAPSILDFLNESSKIYFEQVKAFLDVLNIPYEIDSTLVRGLDYYNHTAFEIMSSAEGFGAITTLCGGGRYNGLVEQMDGPETAGIGFALSVERLLSALEAENIELPIKEELDCYLVSMGDEAKLQTAKLAQELRSAGFSAERDYLDRKVKGQFKAADRLNAKYVAIVGEDELRAGKINVKVMDSGEQKELPLSEFVEAFKALQL